MKPQPLREWLIYGWGASFGILLLVMVSITGHYLTPPVERIGLGHSREFAVNQPQLRALSSTLAVYVVVVGEQLYAWDTTPAVPNPCARIQWNVNANRFEDPCSGAKWCADGTIADGRIPQTRSLTRYAIEVNEEQVYLLPWRKQTGEPAPAIWQAPHPVDWMPPDALYTCQAVPASSVSAVANEFQ